VGFRAKVFLHVQYAIGRLAVFFMAPFVYLCVKLCGYRVRDLKKIRRECAQLFENHRGPWIICPNHLTNIDSVILAYAIAPMYEYMLHFRLLPWNLPERKNFQRNLFSTLMCYLAKCIPVSRGGDREEMKLVMEKCTYLLRRRQPNKCRKSYLWRRSIRHERSRLQGLMRLPARRPSGYVHQHPPLGRTFFPSDRCIDTRKNGTNWTQGATALCRTNHKPAIPDGGCLF
jgi:hypothetical protein